MATQAWYRDESEEKLFEPHLSDPPQFLTFDQVFEKTGVRLYKVENCEDEEEQARLRKEGGYNHHDWLEISREVLRDDYDRKLRQFYAEHLHKDEEIRLITAGSGYFEIRDYKDKWIRLHLKKGDLINLPPGIYHRLTLDPGNYIKMLRLFSEVPQWVAVNRPEGDTHPARELYLDSIPRGTPVAAN